MTDLATLRTRLMAIRAALPDSPEVALLRAYLPTAPDPARVALAIAYLQEAAVTRYEGQEIVRGPNGRIVGNIGVGLGAERSAHVLMNRYGDHVAKGKDPETFTHKGLHGTKDVDAHLQELGHKADAHAAAYTSQQVDKLMALHAQAEEALMRGLALGFATKAEAAKAAREQDVLKAHLHRVASRSPAQRDRINQYLNGRRAARDQIARDIDRAKLQQMAAKLREHQQAAVEVTRYAGQVAIHGAGGRIITNVSAGGGKTPTGGGAKSARVPSASKPPKASGAKAGKATSAKASSQEVKQIPIAAIHTGLNPREFFDPAKIAELAQSIKGHGLLQPISVRPHEGGYQVIAGERRLRALQALGMTHAPVIVHQVDDQTAHELALIENINREDMRPGETARAYQNLLNSGMTIKALAERTGKSTDAIQAHLDLLTLPIHLQALVDKGKLSMGVIRGLARLSPKGQEAAAERILRDDLGVKSANRLIKTISERESQTSLFSEVQPVSQAAHDAQAAYQDTMTRLTEMLSGMDDAHVTLAAQATDTPLRESERLGLMIKQLQRMQGAMETEHYRRAERSARATLVRIR
jgi:ParB family chromosome partitioning protein